MNRDNFGIKNIIINKFKRDKYRFLFLTWKWRPEWIIRMYVA